MATDIFNQREKLAAPPFVTVVVKSLETRQKLFKSRSKLEKCSVAEKTAMCSAEVDLLKDFIVRKGTQLRLEKALMLTRRILTLAMRWKCNSCWNDVKNFSDSFDAMEWRTNMKKQSNKSGCAKGNMQDIRLPSRQWGNWVIYLVLRDLLLMSKIKYECERTVGYWLGMISSSHHPSDSLIIVGILSRIWALSGGIVEEYANHVYPSLYLMSSLLSATKADNWLEDIDFPNDLFSWLEKILGFPFQPASIGGVEHTFRPSGKKRRGSSKKGKSDTDAAGMTDDDETLANEDLSTTIRDMSANDDNEDEDLGEVVNREELGKQIIETKTCKRRRKSQKKQQQQQPCGSARKEKKVILNERWTKFFKNFKAKSDTDEGRKQLLVRIKKYKKTESDPDVVVKLTKLRKLVMRKDQDKLFPFIPKLKRFLSNRSSTT